MEMRISFPGGKRVDAAFGDFVVRTDQPVAGGGEGSAPGPYDLFLASLGTCAGIYVLGFLQARGLSTEGLGIVQHAEIDRETGRPSSIALEIQLPPGVPEKYRTGALRAAAQCKVKKTLESPPVMTLRLADEAGASLSSPAST